MAKIDELKEALCDVRAAHRLIFSYQTRMLDLVRFISAKLDFGGIVCANKYFSNPVGKLRSGDLRIQEGMWAWDFIYSYQIEYCLGEMNLDDNSTIGLSIIQYSDTGFFDKADNSKLKINDFASEEESGSKLLFFIENKPARKKNWVWDVNKIAENKEYASIKHTKTILEKEGCKQGLYSFPLERFIDEKSTLVALQEFIDFCAENDIAELELV